MLDENLKVTLKGIQLATYLPSQIYLVFELSRKSYIPPFIADKMTYTFFIKTCI